MLGIYLYLNMTLIIVSMVISTIVILIRNKLNKMRVCIIFQCFNISQGPTSHPVLYYSGRSRISQRGYQPLKGTLIYYLTNFSRKWHENEEILVRERTHPSYPLYLDPPLNFQPKFLLADFFPGCLQNRPHSTFRDRLFCPFGF